MHGFQIAEPSASPIPGTKWHPTYWDNELKNVTDLFQNQRVGCYPTNNLSKEATPLLLPSGCAHLTCRQISVMHGF